MALMWAVALGAQTRIVVSAGDQGIPIQPTLWGVFFEDINFAADGGLYGEMVKNRSFEFPYALTGWTPFGKVKVMDQGGPFERCPHYVRLGYAGHPAKRSGLENEGFRGIGVCAGAGYEFSLHARLPFGVDSCRLRVDIADNARQVIESRWIVVRSGDWKKYTARFAPERTAEGCRLRVMAIDTITVDLEHISLFPLDTWKGRRGGLRKDLAEYIAALKPGVFRFPGGCIVEGTDLATRYDWKKSVGQVENRPINENRWNHTRAIMMNPDYFQSYGLGFYEYFLFSEDIGAEPLPVLSCGLGCQFQNQDGGEQVPLDQLEPYIQDALDLIEFANGSSKSKWGKVRAEMGHPAPFNLKYIGIGNEQWGEEYTSRFDLFVKAIRKAYPDIKIVGSAGPGPDDGAGKGFTALWDHMRRQNIELVDEHFYRGEQWFLKGATRYDDYDRNGPKVFAGEYACHNEQKINNLRTAICEAAFLTGLERNADVVHMGAYAPLLARTDAWQWKVNLIWFDNMQVIPTPNYYVQKMFSAERATHSLPATAAGRPLTGQDGLFASAVSDGSRIIVRVVNAGKQARDVQIELSGAQKRYTKAELTTLSGDPEAENTTVRPNLITPLTANATVENNMLKLRLEPYSFISCIFEQTN